MQAAQASQANIWIISSVTVKSQEHDKNLQELHSKQFNWPPSIHLKKKISCCQNTQAQCLQHRPVANKSLILRQLFQVLNHRGFQEASFPLRPHPNPALHPFSWHPQEDEYCRDLGAEPPSKLSLSTGSRSSDSSGVTSTSSGHVLRAMMAWV